MDVAAMMPCLGRAEQTVRNVRRLLDSAGLNIGWQLYCVVDGDPDVYEALGVFGAGVVTRLALDINRSGYWSALELATAQTNQALLCNLANDLLPGRHWLARGVAAYQARFGDGDGLMGFNDGLHGPEHSSHFLISRKLLTYYGGWPVWYAHNWGDTELNARTQQDGVYGKAAWATLFHDHVENGAADDEVYQEGRSSYDRDAELFRRRKAAGWPPYSAIELR